MIDSFSRRMRVMEADINVRCGVWWFGWCRCLAVVVDSQLTFTPDTAGTHYVSVGAADNGIGTYEVTGSRESGNVPLDAGPTSSASGSVFGSAFIEECCFVQCS